MIEVKAVAKTMDVKQFEKRFTKENQGFRDNHTGKLHFCMKDFGFKFTQEDCLEIRDCKTCYKDSMKYLKYRADQRRNINE